MADLPNFELPNFQVKENEFYELCNMPPRAYHPHEELRGFKIVMVSKTTSVGDGRTMFVYRWPSMKSLTYFFKENLRVLPTFDKECTMMEYGTLLLLRRPIDPIELCFFYGRLQSAWLDNQGMETLNAAMNLIGDDHMQEVERTHIRPDQLYEIDCSALPESLRDQFIRFARIAFVSGMTEDPNDMHSTVDVRVPSMESLDAFLSSKSLGVLPDFDRVFTISRASASLFLTRVLPLELCFRLRKRRDLWITDDVDVDAGIDEYCDLIAFV